MAFQLQTCPVGTNNAFHPAPVCPSLRARPIASTVNGPTVRRSRCDVRASAAQQPVSLPALRHYDSTSPTDKLCDALSAHFSGSPEAKEAFTAVVSADCTWATPLFLSKGRAELMEHLESFTGLFLEPTVLFTDIKSEKEDQGISTMEWLVSFTYPLPWRPRVTISGSTVLTLSTSSSSQSPSQVTRVEDTWDVSPFNVFYQIAPRISDILWVYPSPHAETDVGTRRVLSKSNGYTIIRAAARPVLLLEFELPKEDQIYLWAVPALPYDSFEGGLRRLEEYGTVSPVSVRRVTGDVFEWEIPVPGNLIGNSRIQPPPHSSPNARFVLSRPRRFAVVRYGGYALQDVFKKQLDRLFGKLRSDGILAEGETVDSSRIWARSYDAKVGFNTKGLLAIATYGTTRGIPPRVNEIAIELPLDETLAESQ